MSLSGIWKMSLCFAKKSDVGLRRQTNQDTCLVNLAPRPRRWLERGHIFVIADGMGAHAAGEVASRLAAETIAKSYLGRTGEPMGQSLVQSVYDAHRAIQVKSREDAYKAMGTTCDAFALTPQGVFIAHVGDSRVYRLRGNTFDQLTFDHSLVWEVCKLTHSSFDNPPSHIPKNQITRSLGPTEKLLVDLEGPLPIETGDTFLACSDGLSGPVSDEEMGQILALFPPDIATESLVNLANLRGGPDNITLVVVQATENPETSEAVDNELLVPGWQWGMLLGAVLSILAGIACFFLKFPAATAVGFLFALTGFAGGLAFYVLTQKTLFLPSPFVVTAAVSGKAPYRTWDCTPSKKFADTLAKIWQELSQAMKEQDVAAIKQEAQCYESDAVAEYKNNQFGGAIKNYALAINAIMRKIKKDGG